MPPKPIAALGKAAPAKPSSSLSSFAARPSSSFEALSREDSEDESEKSADTSIENVNRLLIEAMSLKMDTKFEQLMQAISARPSNQEEKKRNTVSQSSSQIEERQITTKHTWPVPSGVSLVKPDGHPDYFGMLSILKEGDNRVWQVTKRADLVPRPPPFIGQRADQSISEIRKEYNTWVKDAELYVWSVSKQQPLTRDELLDTFANLHKNAPLAAIQSQFQQHKSNCTFEMFERAVLDSFGPEDSIIQRHLALDSIRRASNESLAAFTINFAQSVQDIVRSVPLTRETITTAWVRALNHDLKLFSLIFFEKEGVWQKCPVPAFSLVRDNYMALINWLKSITILCESEAAKTKQINSSLMTESTDVNYNKQRVKPKTNDAPWPSTPTKFMTHPTQHQTIKEIIGQDEFDARFAARVCVNCKQERDTHGKNGFRSCLHPIDKTPLKATTSKLIPKVFSLELVALYGEEALSQLTQTHDEDQEELANSSLNSDDHET